MKKMKLCSVLMAAVMVSSAMSIGAFAEESEELLPQLEGTYDELFTVICDEKYDDLWLELCEKYGDAENAEAYAEMLKGACTGEIYGQEALDAYADAPESAVFDCYFINGVAQFTIEGNTISGTDEDGNEVFSHTYTYAGKDDTGALDLYESDDEDSGAFTYFAFLPDTPDTTYHIEFRYGETLDGIGDYSEGEYAYWLAAGIPADASDEMIEGAIDLFCSENLAEMGAEAETEAAETEAVTEAAETEA